MQSISSQYLLQASVPPYNTSTAADHFLSTTRTTDINLVPSPPITIASHHSANIRVVPRVLRYATFQTLSSMSGRWTSPVDGHVLMHRQDERRLSRRPILREETARKSILRDSELSEVDVKRGDSVMQGHECQAFWLPAAALQHQIDVVTSSALAPFAHDTIIVCSTRAIFHRRA